MDAVTIGGMYESIKALAGLAKTTADAVVDQKVKAEIFKLQQGLYDLQAKALEDQMGRIQLTQQLGEIQRELDSLRNQQAKLDQYELFQVEPGRHVFRSKLSGEGDATHYACLNCLNIRKSIGVLQVEGGYNGQTRYWCTACDFNIYVGQALPIYQGRGSY